MNRAPAKATVVLVYAIIWTAGSCQPAVSPTMQSAPMIDLLAILPVL